jgi:HPt (histidine-containing phosphotransfer) domain-containing protein
MPRLMDFSDGNMDNLRDLVTLYVQQTTKQMGQLAEAVQTRNATEVRRVAHSCAGASATCGMHRLAPLLRQMEHLADAGDLSDTPRLLGEAQQEFQRIREFLTPYCAQPSA